VALVVETSTSFGRRLLRGVGIYVRENGPWSIYVEQRSIYDPAPPWLKNWDGDGIISRAAYPELADMILRTGIPAVDLQEQVLDMGLPRIINDNEAIGRMAATHLLERGYSHFGFIGHPGLDWSEGRRRGFFAAVDGEKHSFAEYCPAGKTLPRYQHKSWEKEVESVARWVQSLPKPAGIMACNDFRAVQLLDACSRAGVAVPEEAAVIGVDDEEVACEMAYPPLSSIVPNALEIGYEAAATLDLLMRGSKPHERELRVPPVGVVARRSSDAMAIADPLVAQAMQFIRRSACGGINVEDVVAHLAVSRSSLQRRFNDELGRTLHDVILDARLERACQLLAGTKLPLAEIADRAGFKHAEYLSAVFKKHFEMTPNAYRKQLH
jgi:LacI family transcriptional regulator